MTLCHVCARLCVWTLHVLCPCLRVSEAVYRRLAQLVGAGDKHLDPRTPGAIVNKRLVVSGGERRRRHFSVNEPPCLSLTGSVMQLNARLSSISTTR